MDILILHEGNGYSLIVHEQGKVFYGQEPPGGDLPPQNVWSIIN